MYWAIYSLVIFAGLGRAFVRRSGDGCLSLVAAFFLGSLLVALCEDIFASRAALPVQLVRVLSQ